jgi:hypothetical protein
MAAPVLAEVPAGHGSSSTVIGEASVSGTAATEVAA